MRYWQSVLFGAAVVGMTVFVGPVRADILPSAGTPTVTPSGTGTFLWTYNTFVTNAQEVVTGDFFRIYDFDGFVAVNSNPINWTPSVALVNGPVTTPTGIVLPTDNPTSPNITFTYSGPTILGGPTPLGAFVLESIYGGPGVIKAFVGEGTDQGTGLQNGNLTNTLGPQTVTAVPEPGMIATGLMMFGGLGLGLVKARRKRV